MTINGESINKARLGIMQGIVGEKINAATVKSKGIIMHEKIVKSNKLETRGKNTFKWRAYACSKKRVESW